jgi:hypothetical protein
LLISGYFIEVAFHGGRSFNKIFKNFIVLCYTRPSKVKTQVLPISGHVGQALLESSSIFSKKSFVFSFTCVDLQMLESKFCSFPAISLLVQVVVAQDMW